MDAHALLKQSAGPIALLDPAVYLYFGYYAPQLATRVYCPRPSAADLSYRVIKAMRGCCEAPINPEITDEEFTRRNQSFLAYGTCRDLDRLAAIGSPVELRVAEDHFLAKK
jgi:hypothetical protein